MKYRADLGTFALLIFTASGSARVTRIVIEQMESPAFSGKAFGKAGRRGEVMGSIYML